jgi:hypothetical protein
VREKSAIHFVCHFAILPFGHFAIWQRMLTCDNGTPNASGSLLPERKTDGI